MPIFELENALWFPDPRLAESNPDGLLAVGGDLSSQRLIKAYQQGIFPWFDEGDPLLWWSPSIRTVLYPSQFHASKSLKKYIKKLANQSKLTITIDRHFETVMQYCSRAEINDGIWITDEMIDAYSQLQQLGYAHSIEVMIEGELVGGLYGVQIAGCFFGESMFSLAPNASKIALYSLCYSARQLGIELIDCQLPTQHLSSLGASEITREHYLAELAKYITQDTVTFPTELRAPHG